MPRDVEAYPSTVIADVPAITAGDCYLTAKRLDAPIGFAEAWQVKEAGCYSECAKTVKHLLTPDKAEMLQELSSGLEKPRLA